MRSRSAFPFLPLVPVSSDDGDPSDAKDPELVKAPQHQQLPGRQYNIVLVLVLLAISALFWILGIFLPLVEVKPFPLLNAGPDNEVAQPVRKSTLGTIVLLAEGQHLLALFIVVFCSFVVPFAKLVATTLRIMPAGSLSAPIPRLLTRALKVLATMSSYQTVDLLVGLLFVSYLNSDTFESTLQPGFAFFAAYCGVSQALLLYLEPGGEEAGQAADGTKVAPASPIRWEVNPVLAAANSLALLLCAALGSAQPLLDVVVTYEDFAVGRQRLGLLGIAQALMAQGGPVVGVLLMLLFLGVVLLGPLVVGALAVAAGALGAGAGKPMAPEETGRLPANGGAEAAGDGVVAPPSEHVTRLARWARALAQWTLPDVFALALVTFLFTVQEGQIQTTIPQGSLFGCTSFWFSRFHLGGLGIGAAGFALKWTAVRRAEVIAGDALDEVTSSEEPAAASRGPALRAARGRWLPPRGTYILAALPWAAWCAFFLCLREPREPTEWQVNAALPGLLPVLNDVLKESLPATAGACQLGNPPQPCEGEDPLYERPGHANGLEVLARWFTGIRSLRLTGARIHVGNSAGRTIRIEVNGTLLETHLSLQIKKCLFGICTTLWDNTDGCCRPNRRVKVVATTRCFDGPRGFAQLEHFQLAELHTDDIRLQENVLGIPNVPLVSLTEQVRGAFAKILEDLFVGKMLILGMEFPDIFARLWRYNTAGGESCGDLFGSM